MRVEPIKSKKTLTKLEMLLKAKSDRDYVIWVLGTNTGLRVGDIVGLKVKDVEGDVVTLKEQKTGKHKVVRLTNKLKATLKNYIAKYGLKSNQNLFSSRQNSSVSIRQVQRVIKAMAKKLNVAENINSHSMRKTYAYNLYTNAGKKYKGMELMLTMKALNHSNEGMTLKYLGLDQDMIFDVMNNL